MSANPMPKVESGSELSSLLPFLQLLQGSFGSGKQTTTSSTAPSAGASSQVDALIAQILGQNDPKNFEGVIGNIMTRAKQEFSPILGQSASAGERGYSSTVVRQLANESMARATAEAARVRLDAVNRNNAIAANLVDTKMKTSLTETREQQTGATPMGNAMKYVGAGLTGYSLYDKMTKKKKSPLDSVPGSPPGTTDYISSIFNNMNPEVADFFAANPGIQNSLNTINSGYLIDPAMTAAPDIASLFGPMSGELSTLMGPEISFGAEAAANAAPASMSLSPDAMGFLQTGSFAGAEEGLATAYDSVMGELAGYSSADFAAMGLSDFGLVPMIGDFGAGMFGAELASLGAEMAGGGLFASLFGIGEAAGGFELADLAMLALV